MKNIAESTVRRLSLYLRFLEEFDARGQATISSGELARLGGTTSAQVRKDLSAFGSFGKRGLGYAVPDLINAIRDILGLLKAWSVIIVGAGKIGAALAQFRGFNERSFNVVGIYDADPAKVGMRLGRVVVRDDDEIEHDIRELKPDIAVVCVPSDAAQAVVDRLVAANIRGILNFASVPLQTPDNVTIRDVNMATELEILAFRLSSAPRTVSPSRTP